MVHYIRFLRTPQVNEDKKRGFSITAVATIVTDLGDSFFGQDIELLVSLVDATRSGQTILTQTLPWRNGDRAAKLNLQCNSKLALRLTRVHITTHSTNASRSALAIPAILDVWSEPFSMKSGFRTEAIVERRLQLSNQCIVRQLEETGDSIARHIWDASLGFLILLQQIFGTSTHHHLPILRQCLLDSPTTRLQVLETGAGCGIVGIALSQLRKVEVTLTDLDDAQDILQSNVDICTPLAGSRVRRQVLEWGPNIDGLSDTRFDLVLVSDCIYNPDSSLLLVDTLTQISQHAANVSILVGFKRRHDADDVFFERMQSAGFVVAETCEIPLPHIMTDYDVAEPKIEMFVYQGPLSS